MKEKIQLRKIQDFPERTRWKTYIELPFQNCDKIVPFQQRKVADFVKDVSRDANVDRVIVFGSSVTGQCHADSDVDFYVQMDEEKKLNLSAYDFIYDLWTNFNVDQRMLNEINQHGVIVYERDVV